MENTVVVHRAVRGAHMYVMKAFPTLTHPNPNPSRIHRGHLTYTHPDPC